MTGVSNFDPSPITAASKSPMSRWKVVRHRQHIHGMSLRSFVFLYLTIRTLTIRTGEPKKSADMQHYTFSSAAAVAAAFDDVHKI